MKKRCYWTTVQEIYNSSRHPRAQPCAYHYSNNTWSHLFGYGL